MLLSGEGEGVFFTPPRARPGNQSLLSEIPRQIAEESAQRSLEKWTIMHIVFERRFVAEAFGFSIGHHRFVVDPSRQLSNPVQSCTEYMTQRLIPALVQQLGNRLESEWFQARGGFWTDPWHRTQRPRR